MNKMTFKVSRTYAETTPESCSRGDFSETGYVYEDRQMTLREIVDELKDDYFCELSAGPIKSPEQCGGLWASTDFTTIDYSDGTDRQESLHIDATPRQLWRIFRAAGLV